MLQFHTPAGQTIYVNPTFVAMVTEDEAQRAIIHLDLPALNGTYIAYTINETMDGVVSRLETVKA